MNTNRYKPLDNKQKYIDKTSELEKGIAAFPSIYIEGAAATGKTTAVKLLLEHHPEVEYSLFRMDNEQEAFLQMLQQKLPKLKEKMEQSDAGPIWILLDDLDINMSEDICRVIMAFIRSMPDNGRVIMLGRECSPELLDLLWKREMELIGHDMLVFTKNEVREYGEAMEASIKADDVYALTEGWPGCVDMLFRMGAKTGGKKEVRELLDTYEIQAYIDREILGTLSGDERKLYQIGCICPWFTEEMCSTIWDLKDMTPLIHNLHKKGILWYNKHKKYYVVPELLAKTVKYVEPSIWNRLSQWYIEKNHIKEAFLCIKNVGNEELYREFLIKYYSRIPFLDVYYGDVLRWEDDRPEVCYLRGMFYYSHQNFAELKKEIKKIKNQIVENADREHIRKEIYLNLMYCNPKEPFAHWMTLLEKAVKEKEQYNLYSMVGFGCSFLCGLRDISELFACSKKEETRQAALWKEVFGEAEWFGYCLARIDFYMETKQNDRLQEDDMRRLYFAIGKRYAEEWNTHYSEAFWRFRQAGLYLLCKWPELEGTDQPVEYIHHLEEQLRYEAYSSSLKNTEAIIGFYSIWWSEMEHLDQWMRDLKEDRTTHIDEHNWGEKMLRAKACLLFGQYEKAEALFDQLIPYLKSYHRYRYYAECLFAKAVLESETGKKGQALRHMMESLLVTGNSRYVNFYIKYGNNGRVLLESYLEWYKNTIPEDWHRKKKYNYGNVLRMPMAEYLEVLVRGAKKESKNSLRPKEKKGPERLTMMETLVLHSIYRGLTNTQICEEQNLKLPTVKSHIYSLYKKLGVSNRVQALNRAKELGLVR